MATAAAAAAKGPKELTFSWEGKDKAGKTIRGEVRGVSEAAVNATLRRQGIVVQKVKPVKKKGGGSVGAKDIALFTRQLATMMKAGVPLLQSFDIVSKGASNPAVGKLLVDIKTDVETGASLAAAFRKFPLYFDNLYCNLVQAGEAAGILETLLDRLATYQEKTLAIKSKIKSALFYPIAIIAVAFIITAVIMIFVIPAFKEVFTNFGADLPGAHAGGDGHLGLVRGLLVHHLPGDRRQHLRLPRVVEALDRRADLHGQADAEGAGVRPPGAHLDHRALDAHAVDHVRRRRAAGRGARLGRRRLGQLRVLPRPPRRSRRRSPPAPRSPSRCRTPTCSRPW